MWSRRDIGIVVGLLLLAGVLRLPAMGNASVWLDDAWVSVVHRVDWTDVPVIGVTAPGYAALMKVWFTLVGFTETTAQLPALVAGIAAPGAAFALLRTRCRWWVATIAGFVITVAPAHITYSGRVKQYTLEVLIGLGLVWLFLRLHERPRERRLMAELAIAATAAVLFSYTLATLVVGCVAAGFVSTIRASRAELRPALAWATLPAFATIALVPFIRSRTNETLRNYWSGDYAVTEDGVFTFLGSLVDRAEEASGSFSLLAAPLTTTVVAGCLIALLVRRPLLFLATATPLIAAFVLATLEISPLGGGRTDLYLMAPLVVGTALGADVALSGLFSLARRVGRTAEVAARTAVGVLVAAIGIWSVWGARLAEYPQQHVRELVEIVDAERAPGESLVLYPAGRFGYAVYGQADLEIVDDPTLTPYTMEFDDPSIVVTRINREDPTKYLPALKEAVEKGDRVWLLGMHLQPDFEAMVRLMEEKLDMRVLERWDDYGARLVLFQPNGSEAE